MPDVHDRMMRVWLPVERRRPSELNAPPSGPPEAGPACSPAPEPVAAGPAPPRSDPLDDRPWMKLVCDCVDLFDELDSQLEYLAPAARDLAEHVCLRLAEILQRNGADPIDQDGPFERTLHQPRDALAASRLSAGVRVLSPGFRVGRRVLRRARVEPGDAEPHGSARVSS